ncbi:MAG TPA: hypothetical protein VNF99_02525 [Stellaceae bacterium]|nr:hypothetical protein [Stellaceae bacterium]
MTETIVPNSCAKPSDIFSSSTELVEKSQRGASDSLIIDLAEVRHAKRKAGRRYIDVMTARAKLRWTVETVMESLIAGLGAPGPF